MIGAVRRFLPDEGFLDAALARRALARPQGRRGARHAARRRRDEDVPGPAHAGDLPAERRRRPAARPRLRRRLRGSSPTTCASRYGAEPGFITMNLPLLLDCLDAVGLENPIVCASINKLGFRMCGGVEAYEEALRDRDRSGPIAMSVLASGAIPAGRRSSGRAPSPTWSRSSSAPPAERTSGRPARSSTSSGLPPDVRVLFDAYWWVRGPVSNKQVQREIVRHWVEEFPQDEAVLVLRHADADRGRPAAGHHCGDHAPVAPRTGVDRALPAAGGRRGPTSSSPTTSRPWSGRSAVFVHDVMFQTSPEWFSRPERAYYWLSPTPAPAGGRGGRPRPTTRPSGSRPRTRGCAAASTPSGSRWAPTCATRHRCDPMGWVTTSASCSPSAA